MPTCTILLGLPDWDNRGVDKFCCFVFCFVNHYILRDTCDSQNIHKLQTGRYMCVDLQQIVFKDILT